MSCFVTSVFQVKESKMSEGMSEKWSVAIVGKPAKSSATKKPSRKPTKKAEKASVKVKKPAKSKVPERKAKKPENGYAGSVAALVRKIVSGNPDISSESLGKKLKSKGIKNVNEQYVYNMRYQAKRKLGLAAPSSNGRKHKKHKPATETNAASYDSLIRAKKFV